MPKPLENGGSHVDHGPQATGEVASLIEPVQLFSVRPLMGVPFLLDRSSKVPLHRQIYDVWKAAIFSGRFHAAERVPSSRAFAATYGVARVTVTAAYDQLLAEGYFETKHGSGTFVSSELPDDVLRPIRVAASAPGTPHRIRLSRYGSRLGDIRRLPASTHTINLSHVSPDLASFPFPLWRRLVSRHVRRASAAVFDHAAQPAGHDDSSSGPRDSPCAVTCRPLLPGAGHHRQRIAAGAGFVRAPPARSRRRRRCGGAWVPGRQAALSRPRRAAANPVGDRHRSFDRGADERDEAGARDAFPPVSDRRVDVAGETAGARRVGTNASRRGDRRRLRQ